MLVVGGYISPSHDQYAADKLLTEGIKAVHRVAMTGIASNTSDWISSSSWESLGNKEFVSFSKVLRAVDNYIKASIHTATVRIMYLCGADLIIRCGGIDKVGDYNIVAVGRPGYSNDLKRILIIAPNLYYVNEDTENISSTLIRERIRNNETVDDLTFPGVTQYLKDNKVDLHFTKQEIRFL